MLILKRRPNQRVRLTLPDGRHVWVACMPHEGGTQLRFEAPKDVVISREELLPEGERYRRLMGLARQCRDLAPHLPPGALDRGTAASLALAGKWARDAAESLAEALARLARRQPEGTP